MAVLQDFKCPCCDGAIEFESSLQKMKCPYCSTEFEMADIECSECSWTAEPGDVNIPTFCPNCGKRFNADDIN